MVEAFLTKIGLTPNETRVYLYLLTHGESIVSVIAKRLGLKRATTYLTLENLEKKKFVLKYEKNSVTHFDAVEPNHITDFCERRLHQIKQLTEQSQVVEKKLKHLRRSERAPTLDIHGKVSYYQGTEAVKQLLNETLENPGDEQLCFGLNTYHLRSDEAWKNYTKKRVEKGMKVKSIQPDTAEAVAYKKRDEEELRCTRLIPHKNFPNQFELNIIGDTLALFFNSEDTPLGMRMKNPNIVKALKILFELAWERAKDYDEEKGQKRK